MKIATFVVLFLVVNAFSVFAEEATIDVDESDAATESKRGKWSGLQILSEIGLGALGAAGGAFALGAAINNDDEGNIYGSAGGTAMGSWLGVIGAGETWGKPTKNKIVTYLVTAGVSLIFPVTVALIYDANRTPGAPYCDDELFGLFIFGEVGGVIIDPIITAITYSLLKDE